MQFDDIRITLLQILSRQEVAGEFLSAKQICKILKADYKQVWNQLEACYPESNTYFNSKYTVETFVANTLKYYATNNGIPGLEQSEVTVTDISKHKSAITTLVWRLS